MTARDELAKLIFVTDNDAAPDPEHEWERATRNGRHAKYAYEIADSLIRAGYTKPRVVTTVEELDALPGVSVVRDTSGMIYEKDFLLDELCRDRLPRRMDTTNQ